MKILITNERLDLRAGSDLFARDLARGLQRRGHFVIAYSSDLHQLERMLERDSIPVVTDLRKLPFRPDVIHARHHLDAMTAVMSLPSVPATYHCVGAAWATALPRHPRICRYIAPSDRIAASLNDEGIAADQIDTILNAIDLDRFTRMREPASRPTRALIYDDLLSPDSALVAAIVSALKGPDMDIDLIGWRFGGTIENPEQQLLGYDLVFARGRKAIEAIACGCSVVVIGPKSCGEMVDRANFEELRTANFADSGDAPPAAETVRGFLASYSAETCRWLAHRIRNVASFPPFVGQIERSYEAVIAANERREADLDEEDFAASIYLQRLGNLIKEMDRKQKSQGDLPLSVGSMFLDVSAKIDAIQLDLRKPHWWPDQRSG